MTGPLQLRSYEPLWSHPPKSEEPLPFLPVLLLVPSPSRGPECRGGPSCLPPLQSKSPCSSHLVVLGCTAFHI